MISTHPSSIPVCSTPYDLVIYGAGVVGYAAAIQCAKGGRSVLLLDISGAELLWEATRALENRAGSKEKETTPWSNWLKEQTGWNGDFFESSQAEIFAATHLLDIKGLNVLFYAMPIALGRDADGLLCSMTVATKGGLEIITGRQWIDATEEGALLKLIGLDKATRRAQECWRSLILSTDNPVSFDDAIKELRSTHPGLESLPSVKPNERRLRWPSGNESWHHQIVRLAESLRRVAREKAFDFAIVYCGSHSFPVYAFTPEHCDLSGLPDNIAVLSPGLRSEAITSIEERFTLGAGVTLPPTQSTLGEHPPAIQPQNLKKWDVVIAGCGTAGAIAAIAAAESGAKTLTFDLAMAPGGMGTGGGVSGYFHGAGGGIQTELDERSREISELMTGTKPIASRWHHDAKICALLERFETKGVQFLQNALLCGVEQQEGRITAALVAHEGKLLRIPSVAWVDSTGDGDLCAMAGADYLFGRQGDGRAMAFTQVGFWITKNTRKLNVTFSNFDAGWADSTNPRDLTRARLIGISNYKNIKQEPNEQLVALAPLIGLRQSRQIYTDRMISLSDMVAGTQFDDAIGSVDTVADTHSVDFEFEADELAFYYWTCRGFRHRLHCDLPYRMLLPKGLQNVWIACRAAGINMEANTGLRMQREMQSLGEAAGSAAALSQTNDGNSRDVNLAELLRHLDCTGARSTRKPPIPKVPLTSLLEPLDAGRPGLHLWHLLQRWTEASLDVQERLQSDNPRTSFYAAALCAMANDRKGISRLLAALDSQEVGPTPEEFKVNGAHGECIDVPFWFQAIILLRRVGDLDPLPELDRALKRENQPFNVITSIALTIEQIAHRVGPKPQLIEFVNTLSALPHGDTLLPPSRSLWRTLYKEPQRALVNNRGLVLLDDHRWQLDLIIHRTRQLLGLPPHAGVKIH